MAMNLFNSGAAMQTGYNQVFNQLLQGDRTGAMPNPGLMMDPSLLQPGFGMAAQGPQQPPREAMMNFQMLQDNHKQEQEQFIKDIEVDVEDRKSDFFSDHHWEIDRNGNRVIRDGGEDAAQRRERRDFERAEKRALRDQHEAAKKRFYERAQEIAKGISPQDPEYHAKMTQAQQELAREERTLLNGQKAEQLGAGLPPQLRGFVDERVRELGNLQAQQERVEVNDPNGQMIQLYQQQTQQFAAQLRNQAQQAPPEWDPNGMLNAQQMFRNQLGA